MPLDFTPDGAECGRLTTYNGATECYDPTVIQNLFRDIIAKLCSELGCGLSWDEEGLQIVYPAEWEDFDYPIDVSSTFGTPVVCGENGLVTAAPSTSNFTNGTSALQLAGTFTGTGAEEDIAGSQILSFLVLNNPSVARPMNFYIGLGAKIGVGSDKPPLTTNTSYVGLQYRINGGAWTFAEVVYSDQIYVGTTLQDGTHILSANNTVLQLSPGASATIDIRARRFATSGALAAYNFALPNGVALGVSA